MKRIDLLRYLAEHGCELLREGGRHSVYVNRKAGKSSTIPRHREINDFRGDGELHPGLENGETAEDGRIVFPVEAVKVEFLLQAA